MTAFGFNAVGAETFAASSPTGTHFPHKLTTLKYPKLFLSLGRYGAPSDVAALALFLSSPGASHLTGAHIILDGGSRYWHTGRAPSKL